jgi:hypothetical protein
MGGMAKKTQTGKGDKYVAAPATAAQDAPGSLQDSGDLQHVPLSAHEATPVEVLTASKQVAIVLTPDLASWVHAVEAEPAPS